MEKIKMELVEQVALYLGVAALGAGMAWAVSLALMQNAGIAAGALPQPGDLVVGDVGYQTSPLWQAAKQLQLLANGSSIVGAALLISVGVRRHTQEEGQS